MKIIDTLGLSCPQPVLLVVQAIKANEKELKILVDNDASLENVTRTCENAKYTVNVSEKNNIYEVEAKLV